MAGWLDLLIEGHDIELVCLVSHEDCLAYGGRLARSGEGERPLLERDLAEAKRLIAARYPAARVECFVVPRGHGDLARLGPPERVAL
jgi:hypothetical protein